MFVEENNNHLAQTKKKKKTVIASKHTINKKSMKNPKTTLANKGSTNCVLFLPPTNSVPTVNSGLGQSFYLITNTSNNNIKPQNMSTGTCYILII